MIDIYIQTIFTYACRTWPRCATAGGS